MDWFKIGQEFGLVGILVCGVLVGFFFILKWVLEQFKVELIANRQERKEYLDTLSKINSELCEHNARAKEFHISSNAEHKEMITILGRINGFKDH